MRTVQIKGELDPAGRDEIKAMIEEHGVCCVPYLEDKFSVLILDAVGGYEVFQLPEVEEA